MNKRYVAYSEQVVDARVFLHAHTKAVAQQSPGVVDSLLHPLAILIRQLLTRSGRMDLDLILIDDEENIIQALHAGIEIHSLYYSGAALSKELLQKLPADINVHEVARRTCKKIFENDKVSRVFAIAHAPVMPGLDSLLDIQNDIVVLEDLTISGNIGAIVLTSLAFGAGGIILLNAEPIDIYDRRLIRASRGHVFSLPILAATTEEFIWFCTENQLPILVMESQTRLTVDETANFPRRFVIALGSEKNGCSQTVKDAATLQVQIPIHARVESLNVSTAAGIMLYKRLWFNHPRAGK